ncbi:MAG: glycosyltransferase [Firmicutes bacterium]|nr:glycosyltransferase [Bacillota bacterium]
MISLCMIVKNEEHCLARCLSSAQDCVDEIIIVDTGSDDNTVEIAKQFGAKTFYYQWNDDFASARNYSLSKASGDWVIYLDADEELEPNCCDRFRNLINNNDVEGYYFLINNVVENNDPIRHINVRMFRNKPEYRFESKLHEQILSAILNHNKKKNVVTNSGVNIFHYGYTASEYINKNKGERNYRIIKTMLDENPNDPFHLYNMGNCLINLNDIKGAAVHFSKALKHIDFKATYAPSVFMACIHSFLKLGNLTEAIKLVNICKRLYPDYVDIHFFEGEIYKKMGHWQRARVCFKKCLTLGEKSDGKYTTRTGTGSFRPLFQLAEIYKSQNKIEKALKYQLKGLKIKNHDINDYINFAHLLKLHLKDSDMVLDVLNDTIKHQNKTTEKMILARLFYELDEFDQTLKVINELSVEQNEAHYLKGLALMKKSKYNEAVKAFSQIDKNNVAYTNALLEQICAYWCSIPPKNASLIITQSNFKDQDSYLTCKYLNDVFFDQQPDNEISINSQTFNNIIDRLLSYNQINLLLKTLTLCGLDTPAGKIDYLMSSPVTNKKLELAAKLALQEIKQNNYNTLYFHTMARYFLNNDDLEMAQSMIYKAIQIEPDAQPYTDLIDIIHRKHTLKTLQDALYHYPDNPQFNQYLIDIYKEEINSTKLKGAH